MAEASEGGQFSANDLVKNLRALVQEEVRNPAPPPIRPANLPTRKDAVWLVVLLSDAALLSYWYPEDAKGPFEFLKELLPWLLGGAFVVLNNWFRDHLLEWSRRRWIRGGLLAFLAVGIATGVKVIPINPEVGPPGTVLMIGDGKDDKPEPADERLWLTLHNHSIVLAHGKDDRVTEARRFDLAWWRVAWAAVAADGRDWRRVYRAGIDTPAPVKVTIILKDGAFDFDFLRPANLYKWGLRAEKASLRKWGLGSGDDPKPAITFQSSGEVKTDVLSLPWGHYWIGMEGCRPEDLEVKAIILNTHQMQECTKLGDAGS